MKLLKIQTSCVLQALSFAKVSNWRTGKNQSFLKPGLVEV